MDLTVHFLSKTLCEYLKPLANYSLNPGDSFTYPQMFVGPLEAWKMTFVVGYNQGYRRMKAYVDLHAYLEVASRGLTNILRVCKTISWVQRVSCKRL